MPRISKERIITRGVLIFGIITYVWYTSKPGKEIMLASQKEMIPQRGQSFQCDPEFQEEIAHYPLCFPNKCGRHVTDKLVTATEADALLRIAMKGMALGGSDGGATILDLHSGALSLGQKFINIYSMDEAKKIFTSSDLAVYRIVKEKIKSYIAQTFQIDSEGLFLTHPTFFSKLNNVEPKTDHDEYWHPHVDKVNTLFSFDQR